MALSGVTDAYGKGPEHVTSHEGSTVRGKSHPVDICDLWFTLFPHALHDTRLALPSTMHRSSAALRYVRAI